MVSLIVAASENNVIGRENDLPWSLPDDLNYFRKTTAGHPVVMGRKNHESIGRLLPGRANIIVTRKNNYEVEGGVVVGSLETGIQKAIDIAIADNRQEIFVIGGGEIFQQALPLADRMYITRVHANVPGDAFFPEFDTTEWQLTAEKHHAADEKHQYPFTFQTWERKR